ncbi:hypothetical protein A9168_04725 [Macellibacteroides sp. HH-ZS]|nr:hypothetical protein A9168_04725 [Macellibacteroides sp. HH-ZS]
MTTGQNQPKSKTLRKQIILVSIVLFLLVYLASTWLDEGGDVQKFSFLLFFHMIFIHISQNKASIKEMIATKKVNVITTLTFISFVVMLNNFVLVLFGVSFTNMTVHYWLVSIFLILAVIHSVERLLKR